MFHTYNTKEFGRQLKEIRETLGLSQEQVSKEANISSEGLRKIEKGKVIAKYNTLESLSYVLKRDVSSLFQSNRMSHEIYNLLQEIDAQILKANFKGISKIENELDNLKLGFSLEDFIDARDVNLLQYLIKSIKSFYDEDLNLCYEYIIKALTLYNSSFNITCWENFEYHVVEKRLLYMLAQVLSEHKNYILSNQILEKIMGWWLHSNKGISTQLAIKTYFSLSYNSHSIKSYKDVIVYSTTGIEICKNTHSMYSLNGLYYRRGIAKFLMNDHTFLEDLKLSIKVLEINGHNKLKEIYINKTKEMYGINIEC